MKPTKLQGPAGREASPAKAIDARGVKDELSGDPAVDRLLALAVSAIQAPPGAARDRARNRCRAVVAIFERLAGAISDEVLARQTGRPRWDLRRTTIVVHHAQFHEDAKTAPREVTIDVGAGVELSAAARAQLRDHAHAVSGAVLGTPAPGQRTEVRIRPVDTGIPSLDDALGVGPAAEALWRDLVRDVERVWAEARAHAKLRRSARRPSRRAR